MTHVPLPFDVDPGFAFPIQTRARAGEDATVGLRLADCFPVGVALPGADAAPNAVVMRTVVGAETKVDTGKVFNGAKENRVQRAYVRTRRHSSPVFVLRLTYVCVCVQFPGEQVGAATQLPKDVRGWTWGVVVSLVLREQYRAVAEVRLVSIIMASIVSPPSFLSSPRTSPLVDEPVTDTRTGPVVAHTEWQGKPVGGRAAAVRARLGRRDPAEQRGGRGGAVVPGAGGEDPVHAVVRIIEWLALGYDVSRRRSSSHNSGFSGWVGVPLGAFHWVVLLWMDICYAMILCALRVMFCD